MKNNKKRIIGILCLFIVMFASQASALEQNITLREQAENSIQNMKEILNEMNSSGFSTIRVNDSLYNAGQIYAAQKILASKVEKINKTANRSLYTEDYSYVFKYEQEVLDIKEMAFKSKDEMFSLRESLISLKQKGINMSEAELLLDKMEQEIKDERYERALDLESQIRKKIIELESSATTLNLFYKTTRRTITDFLKENYKKIIVVTGAIIIAYMFLRKRLLITLKKAKLRNLELEKSIVHGLVQKLQKQYFEEGSISEADYTVKIRKYGELIRDIDRRVPLLIEEIEIISKAGGTTINKELKSSLAEKPRQDKQVKEFEKAEEKENKKIGNKEHEKFKKRIMAVFGKIKQKTTKKKNIKRHFPF